MNSDNDFKLVTMNQDLELLTKSSYIVSPVYTIVCNKLQVWHDLASYHKDRTVNKILLYLLTNKLISTSYSGDMDR